MRKYLFLFLWVSFFGQSVFAQCETCHPPAGVIVNHCYSDSDLSGLCVMFTEDSQSFYYEDAGRKKNKVIELKLPGNLGVASIDYLCQLQSQKKLKLSSKDLLFMQHAIENWRQIESIRLWKTELVFSGYTITDSGLGYKALKMGTGPIPQTGQTVKVHYTGYLTDGKKFDSSLDRKATFEFPLGKGRVIKGWDEGLALMPAGSRFLFRIPANLAYGQRGVGSIPANSILFFDVHCISAR